MELGKVKRISPVGNIYGWEESEFGEYVSSEDYDALKAERDALAAQLAELKGQEPVAEILVDSRGMIVDAVRRPSDLQPGFHTLYAKPVSAEHQVIREGIIQVTEEQVEKHSMTAWECPPQSRVFLVSSLKRLSEKNATAPQPVAQEGEE